MSNDNYLERVSMAFSRLRSERQKVLRRSKEEAFAALEQQEVELMEKAMEEGSMPDDPAFKARLESL